MTRFVLCLLFLPSVAFAADFSIDTYVPPPMFGEEKTYSSDSSDRYPPLPPRRPDKMGVPKSYIEHLKKYGKAPNVSAAPYRPARPEVNEDNLVQPTAQDILDQINPQ